MRPLKGKVSITLDSDIIQTIRDYAEKDDRSFSQYINMVLKEYISRQGRTDEHSLVGACFLLYNENTI